MGVFCRPESKEERKERRGRGCALDTGKVDERLIDCLMEEE